MDWLQNPIQFYWIQSSIQSTCKKANLQKATRLSLNADLQFSTISRQLYRRIGIAVIPQLHS
ncbi:MAG: hypothetical protein MUF49_16265 [Oculatellaceae cyanobacterium Prado106]|jgi:hypothetical protein|nr:hypothetical protein [Oculatellaceae cyanobacterium Prado106]